MSRLSIFYAVIAAFIVIFYAVSTAAGWEFFHPPKEEATKDAKENHYRGRTFIFVHSGGGGFRGK